MSQGLPRRVLCEAAATAFLLAAIAGSGISGEALAGGNAALALLANSLATGAMLAVLILVCGPVSGAHMNPAVTLASALAGTLAWRDVAFYTAAQAAGALAGIVLAHAMFDLPLLQLSGTSRSGPGQWLSEGVAAFGLVLTILGCAARAPASLPFAVGLYIVAAFWFTASTSFANPAVTLARMFTDTFAGIAPTDVAPFIAAQFAGALIATGCRGIFVRAA